MRTLSDALGISPTTLYTMLRLAVQALMLVRRGKKSVEVLADRFRELQNRLASVEQAYDAAQAEVQRLTKALNRALAQVVKLQAQVTRLQEQWTVSQKRLVAVLKLSGRCSAQHHQSDGVRVWGIRLGGVCARGYRRSRCECPPSVETIVGGHSFVGSNQHRQSLFQGTGTQDVGNSDR